MTRTHARRFNDWLRHYSDEAPNVTPPIGDTLQPVIIVDDASHVQAPVVVPSIGGRALSTAFAGLYSAVVFRAGAAGFLLRHIRFSASQFVGLHTANPITANQFVQVPSWVTGRPETIVYIGTVGAGWIWTGFNPLFPVATETWNDHYVPPGLFLSVSATAVNTPSNVNSYMIQEPMVP